MEVAGWTTLIEEYLVDCQARGLEASTLRSYRTQLEQFRAWATSLDLKPDAVRARS